MSASHVDTLLRGFDAFARRDRDAWCELCDPEIEVVPVGDWPEGPVRGRSAVWDFFVAADEPWEPGVYEFGEIVEGEDQLVVRQRRQLSGRSSDIEVDYDYWVLFRFRDGKPWRAEWFATRDEALAAAGLSG